MHAKDPIERERSPPQDFMANPLITNKPKGNKHSPLIIRIPTRAVILMLHRVRELVPDVAVRGRFAPFVPLLCARTRKEFTGIKQVGIKQVGIKQGGIKQGDGAASAKDDRKKQRNEKESKSISTSPHKQDRNQKLTLCPIKHCPSPPLFSPLFPLFVRAYHFSMSPSPHCRARVPAKSRCTTTYLVVFMFMFMGRGRE